MRLICPNCSARYEVPADVIPAEGRDVQCSNCQETWFQTHPDTEPQTDVAQTLKEHFAQTEPEAAPIPEQSDAVSETDPIDYEFERALDQELDTIAEDDPDVASAPAITHERSKREIDPLSRISCAKKRSVNANSARLKHSNIRMNLPLIRMNPHLILSPRKAGTSTQSWTIWTKCTKIRHQMHQHPAVICCQISKK